MKVVLYWLARTGIFAVILTVLWLVDWFDLIAIFAAFLLAWLVSYLLLPGMRRDAQLQMEQILDRSRRKIQESHAEEDAELDGTLNLEANSERDLDGEDESR